MVNALIDYIKLTTNQNFSLSVNLALTIAEVDDIVGQLETNVFINTKNALVMTASPNQDSDIVVGVLFQSNIGGQLIRNSNQSDILKLAFSAAAVIRSDSLIDVTRLSMLVIDKPVYHHRFTDSMRKKVVSSIIVAKVHQNNSSPNQMNISLYFTKQFEYTANDEFADSLTCSYYNTSASSWDESGCTSPTYNHIFNRYECSCNHLTTFALLYTIEPSLSTSYSTYKLTHSTSSVVRLDTTSYFGNKSFNQR